MDVNAVSDYFHTRVGTVRNSARNPGLPVSESGHRVKEMDRMAGSQGERVFSRIVVGVCVGQRDYFIGSYAFIPGLSMYSL